MSEEASCQAKEIHDDPHFAVICSFFQRYGLLLGLPDLSFQDLQVWIEDTRHIPRTLQDILVKLLRRWRSSVSPDRIEKSLIKFCYTYSQVDAWELEEFGFPRCKLSTKLRIIKNLIETQFDCNSKFKEKINELSANDLRFLPLGRDSSGLAYWFLLDNDFNVRVYREQQDDVESETWEMVVRNRDDLVELIAQLASAKSQEDEKSRSTTPSTEDTACSRIVTPVKEVDKEEVAGKEIKEEKKEEIEVKAEIKTEVEETKVSVKEEPEDSLKEESNDSLEEKPKDSSKVDGKDSLKEEPPEDVVCEKDDNPDVQKEEPPDEEVKEAGTGGKDQDEVEEEEKASEMGEDEKESEGDVSKESAEGSKPGKSASVEESTVKVPGDKGEPEKEEGSKEENCEEQENADEEEKEDERSEEVTDAPPKDEKEVSPASGSAEKPRKRKRGAKKDAEEEEGQPSDSDLSETSAESSANSEEPPSKRKRERSRKTASQRDQRKRREELPDDLSEDEKESLNCKKARKQASEEKSSEEQSQEEQAKVLSSGSDKENKRRLGAESQEHTESDYEPSSKKGRQTQHQRGKGRGRGRGRGRGAGRGQASRAVPHTASDSDEDSVPLIQLRRSSRANKGQRVVEPLYSTDTTPKRKSKKEKDREERARLKAERAEKKRLRELRRQEKAAARNGKKKKRGLSDEDFIPGKKGRKKKKNSDDETSSESEDEELFKEAESESLHWSSSSSEMEELDSDGEEYVPSGRNAKRVAERKQKEAEAQLAEEDFPCTKCGKSSHPEWILLCDKCDAGHHTACLRPPLMMIPDGDWFCPACEHIMLIEKLQTRLQELDSDMKKKEALVKRKERLAYVGISLANILPDGEKERKEVDYAESEENTEDEEERKREVERKRRERRRRDRERQKARRYSGRYGSVWDDSDCSESSASSSSSSEEEVPMVAVRSKRNRKEINYKFEEFDEMISAAVEEDIKAPLPPVQHKQAELPPQKEPDDGTDPVSRGKDMANITGMREVLEAEERAVTAQDEEEVAEEEETGVGGRPPPVIPRSRKRGRRLTQLESDEEGDESEEYKATDDDVSEEEDEDYQEEEEELSDEFLSIGKKRGKKARSKSSRLRGPVRRSVRNVRSKKRYEDDEDYGESDEDRINYCEESDASNASEDFPKHKKRNKGFLKNKNVLYSDEEEEEAGEEEEEEEKEEEVVKKKPSRRRASRYDDDSDYVPSDDGVAPRKSSQRSSKKSSRYKESSSEEEYMPSKKAKGRLSMGNFIKSSGESESHNSEEEEEEEEEEAGDFEEQNSEKEEDNSEEEAQSEEEEDSSKGKQKEITKVNGDSEHKDSSQGVKVPSSKPSNGQKVSKGAVEPKSTQNGGFMIDDLLKNSNTKSGATSGNGADVDSLSDVDELDLVDYVTQQD